MPHPFTPKRLAALAPLLLLALPLKADIEFTGYFVAGGKTSIALSDTTTNTSAWLAVGARFEDYTLSAYDPQAESITLTRDAETTTIRLKQDGKVKEGRFVVSGTYRIGTGPAVQVTRATLVIGAENVLPLAADVVLRITPEITPDGNMRYKNIFERRGADGRPTVLSAPTVLARPQQAFSVRVDGYEYAFDPKAS